MAITKTHPIKSTLKLAIDYILNPEKTDGKILVSSFGCAPETADLEFEWTQKLSPQRGTHLARHLIQSFEPGETTPEQAHEIGKRLADEVLGGKFEYIISTHTDKGHVHNHIIFNAVSFVDYNKYHSNKNSYHNIRRISDKLCKEYGLSVIEPSKDKGKSYMEYNAAKNEISWKAKLKQMIDKVIPQAKDFDDFIRLMEQNGYEVKRGKYISFRATGQERFTRAKHLARITQKKLSQIGLQTKPNRIGVMISVSVLSLTFRITSRHSRARAMSIGLNFIIYSRLQRQSIS